MNGALRTAKKAALWAVLPSEPTIRNSAWTDCALRVESQIQTLSAAATPLVSSIQLLPPSAEYQIETVPPLVMAPRAFHWMSTLVPEARPPSLKLTSVKAPLVGVRDASAVLP